MKFSLVLSLVAATVVYSKTIREGIIECNNTIRSYRDCMIVPNSNNYEEKCEIISSSKCQKFFANPQYYLAVCAESKMNKMAENVFQEEKMAEVKRFQEERCQYLEDDEVPERYQTIKDGVVECNDIIRSYTDCMDVPTSSNYEEQCKIVASDKCQKFYANPQYYLAKCADTKMAKMAENVFKPERMDGLKDFQEGRCQHLKDGEIPTRYRTIKEGVLECNDIIESYRDCLIVPQSSNYEEQCLVIGSEKCQKFFKNPQYYLARCADTKMAKMAENVFSEQRMDEVKEFQEERCEVLEDVETSKYSKAVKKEINNCQKNIQNYENCLIVPQYSNYKKQCKTIASSKCQKLFNNPQSVITKCDNSKMSKTVFQQEKMAEFKEFQEERCQLLDEVSAN
ncbi:hypothetical protein PIROE2DRAFT_62017 [Piromyces sp. E2]|nr:hypothetical protein PIROE2DRAFT_62017 [Piromyces sp. E2]|eukprot:OUM62270.1 hypothetical protein PIROE2DRAFT_62017 [Piromyces sp. E2]